MTGSDGSEVFSSEPYEGMWLSFGSARDANASLIAAAPELLEALEDMLITCEHGDFSQAGASHNGLHEGDVIAAMYMDKARAVIAKAKGEAP